MSGWPIVDRDPVRLPALPGHDDELWSALIELSELRPGEWTLVGGQIGLAAQLTKKDRQRVRSRSEMADADQRAWTSLPADASDRGRAAFGLLVG